MLRALIPSRCAPAPKVPAGARSPLSQRRRGAPLRALPFRRQQSVDPDDGIDDDSSLMAEFAAASAQFKPARTAAQRRFLEMGLRIRGRVRNCMGCGMRLVLAAAGRPRRSAIVLTGSLLCNPPVAPARDHGAGSDSELSPDTRADQIAVVPMVAMPQAHPAFPGL